MSLNRSADKELESSLMNSSEKTLSINTIEMESFENGGDILETDLEKLGKKQAYFFEGNIDGLLNGMRQISFAIENKLSHDVVQQEKYKQFVKEEITKQEGEKELLEEEKVTILDVEIPMLKEKIEKIEEKIRGVHEEGEQVPRIKNKVERLNLVILAFLIVTLTIYLIVFYSSAFYSAFFKDFKPDKLGLSNFIFEPKAFSNAYEAGVSELLLILFVPFLFLGLGFVIHQFWEKNNMRSYLRSAPFLLVTFAFDCILAYHISVKIYQADAMSLMELELPKFDLEFALKNEVFWLIIFAGFVVYIIWGALLKYLFESYRNQQYHYNAMVLMEQKHMRLEKELENKLDRISQLKKLIVQKAEQLDVNQEKLNGTIIPVENFKFLLQDFVVGWMNYLSINDFDQDFIAKSDKVAADFIGNSITQLRMISLRK